MKKQPWRREAVMVFLFLLCFALFSNYYNVHIFKGYSWGEPYLVSALAIMKYTNNTDEFKVGDYLVYNTSYEDFNYERLDFDLVVHKIVSVENNSFITEAYIYGNASVKERVYFDQIVGKYVFVFPIKRTNDYFEVCIRELRDDIGTTRGAVYQCIYNEYSAEAIKSGLYGEIIIDWRGNES